MICRLAIGLPTLRAFECYSMEPLTKHTGKDIGKAQPGSLQECLCVYNEKSGRSDFNFAGPSAAAKAMPDIEVARTL